jgi:hypothetical protein
MEHIKKQKAYQNDQRIDQLKAKSLSKHKTRRVMEHINVKHLVVEQFVGSITRVHWIVAHNTHPQLFSFRLTDYGESTRRPATELDYWLDVFYSCMSIQSLHSMPILW